ncbi:MAG: helix-turn-helix domain containing protein [Prevotellaceae bacterium]|nr:helix-turn-helix domain containing protein [Prevotellaceae bacterium]
MSKPRVYSQCALDTMQRYFDAVDVCRREGLIPDLTAMLREYGIHKSGFYTQRRERQRGYFEVGWLLPLVERCGVSAHWLLTGKGLMFQR